MEQWRLLQYAASHAETDAHISNHEVCVTLWQEFCSNLTAQLLPSITAARRTVITMPKHTPVATGAWHAGSYAQADDVRATSWYPSGTMPLPAAYHWSHAHAAAPINQYASSMYPAYAGMDQGRMVYTPPLPMYVYGPYGGNAAWVPAAAAAVTLPHMPVPQPDEDAASNPRKRYSHRPAYVYELADALIDNYFRRLTRLTCSAVALAAAGVTCVAS